MKKMCFCIIWVNRSFDASLVVAFLYCMCVTGRMEIRTLHRQMLCDNEISKQKNCNFYHKRQQQSKVILPKKMWKTYSELSVSYAQLMCYYKCYIRWDGNVWATLPESLICLWPWIILCAHLSLWPDGELTHWGEWLEHYSPCRLFTGFRDDCRGTPKVEHW